MTNFTITLLEDLLSNNEKDINLYNKRLSKPINLRKILSIMSEALNVCINEAIIDLEVCGNEIVPPFKLFLENQINKFEDSLFIIDLASIEVKTNCLGANTLLVKGDLQNNVKAALEQRINGLSERGQYLYESLNTSTLNETQETLLTKLYLQIQDCEMALEFIQ